MSNYNYILNVALTYKTSSSCPGDEDHACRLRILPTTTTDLKNIILEERKKRNEKHITIRDG